MTIHTEVIDSGYKTKQKSCIEQGSLGILITWIPPVTPHCKFFGGLPIQIGHAISFWPTTVTVEPRLTDTPQQRTLLNSGHQWYNRQFWKFWLSFYSLEYLNNPWLTDTPLHVLHVTKVLLVCLSAPNLVDTRRLSVRLSTIAAGVNNLTLH